jgi:hypothetical protein
MDPADNDFVNDDPLAANDQRTLRRRRKRRAPSVLEPAPPGRWQQTRVHAGRARERTELFLRENPVPMVLGALAAGLALGLAIRYGARSDEEAETKTPLNRINWSVLSLPFLWPFLRSIKEKYEDSAESVKESARNIDLQRYTKPIRKRWKSWTS